MNRVFSFFLLLLCVAPGSTAAEWTAREEMRDGVLHVINPETPRDGEQRVELDELWRAGHEDDGLLFGVIRRVLSDERGNVYVLDSQLSEIQVLSADGRHLRTIGREGEGPGEFRNATDMFRGPGGVLGTVQIFPGKVVRLTSEGNPFDSFPLPEIPGGGFQLVYRMRANAERIVMSGAVTRGPDGDRKQVKYLKAFDRHGNELVHFYDVPRPTRYGGMQFQEPHWTDFQYRWALADDGRVAAALDFDDYRIHVWNADGSLDRVVERPGYERVRRDKDELERFQKMYDALTRWNPGSSFSVSETHETLPELHYREDGSLWVQTSAGTWQRDPDVFASLDVFDPKGHYVQRVHLVAPHDIVEDGLFLLGDRAYVVTDFFSAYMAGLEGDTTDDDSIEVEPTSLIAYRMRAPTLGMK